MPRCDHIAFRVSDLERSIAFYERLLPGRLIGRKAGTDRWKTEVAWIEPEGQPGYVVVLIQPTRVRWLLRLFHRLVPRQTRSFEHLGFACDSRDAVDARARVAAEMGVPILFGPEHVEGTGYLFEVADPDNNPIEWTWGKTFGGG